MKYTGVVDWFDIDKGFGYIKSDSFAEKLFVHYSSIETDGFKYLNDEDAVEGNRG